MKQILFGLLIVLAFVVGSNLARPQDEINGNNQELDAIEPEDGNLRNGYYEVPSQSYYPNVPLDRLQLLLAHYRPAPYLRSPTWNAMNELIRSPETKRQVRYRQCYFNPISCFKK